VVIWQSFCPFFSEVSLNIRDLCEDYDKAKDELIARNPVIYQKTLFRAFLHLEREEKKNIEYFTEYKKLKSINEYQEYLKVKSEEGYELIEKQKTFKTLFFPYYGIYLFKKEEIELDNMSIQDYIDNHVYLRDVLRIIHAPYQNTEE
jgi:hypothetical protein